MKNFPRLFLPVAALAALSAGCGRPLPPAPRCDPEMAHCEVLPLLDPQMKEILDELASLGGEPMETLTAAQARKQPTPAAAVKSLLKRKGLSPLPEPVAKVENREIAGTAGSLPARVYWPKGQGPFPVLLYFHGGGWVIGDLDTYDATPRALANLAGCIVVSAHYRQAPEHPFPAAHDDALAAYRWVLDHAADLGGDPARIAIAGESAGGTLAASVAIQARDSCLPLPLHQLLIYPVAGDDFSTASYEEFADARPLNRKMMKWFLATYASGPGDLEDSRISLARAPTLEGLPPSTILAAEIDPLRSEGKAYGDLLRAAGVDVVYRSYDGVTHEFFGMGAAVDKARTAQKDAAERLRHAFAGSDPLVK